jgi:threonine dehydrogenase-like Zn-dependent dehydrogenase
MTERQILFRDVEQAELVETSRDPKPLGPDEVQGKTLYSLVSAGTELNIYLGNYMKEGLAWGRLPFVPGYAAVFAVEQVGADVKDVSAGDLLYCMGPHRSFQRLARQDTIPVPAGLAPEQATFARIMNITMSTLTTTPARPPEKVMVTGLGPVGLLGALMFQASGYEVYACEPSEKRRAMAAAAGLRRVLARIPLDDAAVKGQVALVVECSGHEQAVLDGCKTLMKGGELVVVGVPMVRRTDIYAQELLNLIFRQFITVRSGKEQQVPKFPVDFLHNSQFGNMRAALAWLADGRIPVRDLYTIASPKDAQAVYQDVLHQRLEKLAAIIQWGAP